MRPEQGRPDGACRIFRPAPGSHPGFLRGAPRRGLFKVRKDLQKPRRDEIAQRRVPTLRKMRKRRARCKYAIAGTFGRGKISRGTRGLTRIFYPRIARISRIRRGAGTPRGGCLFSGARTSRERRQDCLCPQSAFPRESLKIPAIPVSFRALREPQTQKKLRAGGRLGAF